MQGKPWGEERYREREGEIERKKGRKKKGGSRMHVRGWVATASDGFELGKVQRLKRDTPHPLHPFESTPPWFTLPPSSPASFLASPRLLSPVGQLHSCTNPRAPTIPPQTNRASRAHVYTYTCTICECTCAHRHIHKRVPLPICTLLCHLPSTSAQHAARFPLCVRVTTIPTTWTTARSSFLVALHRANDTTGKGITLLVPFGIAFQKERCLMRYPNISPRRHSLSLSLFVSFSFSSPAAFFLLASSSLLARFLSCLQLLPSTCTRFQDSSHDYQEIRDYRLIILGAVKRTNYRIELRFRLPLCVSYIETRDAIRRSCRESENKRRFQE